MPILPRPVAQGQPVRAVDYNQLLDFVRSLQVQQGIGIRLTKNTNGTIVSLQSTPEQALGGVDIIHPFKVTDASNLTDGAAVNIRFGLLNDVTPTLDDSVTELTTLTKLLLSPDATTGTWKVVLIVAIVEDDTVLVPEIDYVWIITQKDYDGSGEDPALVSHQIIAEVDVVAGDGDAIPDHVTAIRQVVTHSLRWTLCGRQVADEEADPPVAFNPGVPEFWGV